MKSNRTLIHAGLREILTARSLIAGVGNRLRGDDGAGPAAVDALMSRGVGVRCIDCGAAPENFLEKIVAASPDVVFFIDAADWGAAPGAVRMISAADIDGAGGLSTHALSLRMACDYLAARGISRIFLLAVQPESVEIGSGLSPCVDRSIRCLAKKIAEITAHA